MEKRSQECEEKIFSLGSNNVEKDDKGKKLWEESLPVKALNELNLGQQGKVIRVAGKGSIRRRILDMGITQGVEIYVKGIAPLGAVSYTHLDVYKRQEILWVTMKVVMWFKDNLRALRICFSVIRSTILVLSSRILSLIHI